MASYTAGGASGWVATPTRNAVSRQGSGLSTTLYFQNAGDSMQYTGQNLDPVVGVTGMVSDGFMVYNTRQTLSMTTYTRDWANYISNSTEGIDERIGINLEPNMSVSGFDPSGYIGSASLIPTAYFRKVTGVIVDNQGRVINNAKHIVSLDNFGIVGEVDDNGVFEIYLLRQTYSDFMIVADEGKKEGVDIVWYESEGAEVSIYDDSKQLTFDTSQTLSGGGGGLKVGGGVNLG